MSWVFDQSAVTHRGDLLVLLVLADHAHDDGSSAYPSVDKIATKARLTRRGTQLALRRLEQCGAITPEGRGPKGTTSYRIAMGANSLRSAPSSQGEVSDTGGRTESHEGANPGSPEPSKNHQEPPIARERAHVRVVQDLETALLTGTSSKSHDIRTLNNELDDYWATQQGTDSDHARLVDDETKLALAYLTGSGRGHVAEQLRNILHLEDHQAQHQAVAA
jgi:hypothetical protein